MGNDISEEFERAVHVAMCNLEYYPKAGFESRVFDDIVAVRETKPLYFPAGWLDARSPAPDLSSFDVEVIHGSSKPPPRRGSGHRKPIPERRKFWLEVAETISPYRKQLLERHFRQAILTYLHRGFLYGTWLGRTLEDASLLRAGRPLPSIPATTQQLTGAEFKQSLQEMPPGLQPSYLRYILDGLELDIRGGHPIPESMRDFVIDSIKGSFHLQKRRGSKRDSTRIALVSALKGCMTELASQHCPLPDTRNDASEPISKLDAIVEAAHRLGKRDLNYARVKKRIERVNTPPTASDPPSEPKVHLTDIFLPPWPFKPRPPPPPTLWDMFPKKYVA